MADEYTNKVADAYVQIIPTMEGSRSSISDLVTDSLGGVGEEGGTKIGEGLLSGIGGKLKALPALMAAAVSVGAVAAVGKALLDIGEQFDDMTDNIIIGTGASGDALAGLEASARAVATAVPTSFGDAGQIVADLNTRLGITGDELTELATKVAALDSFTGQATDINQMTGAMVAFGVATEDMSSTLDYLWGVSQSTGLSMSEMLSTLEASAPQLTALGFSMQEAANMAGLLDKAGINATSTMSSMSRALVNLSQPGEDVSETFRNMLVEMQGFIEAGDDAAALDLANTVFGSRAATRFVAAVKSGTLSLEALGDAAVGAGGDIMATLDATMSWQEQLQIITNELMVMIEPLASALFEGLGQSMEGIAAALASVDVDTIRGIGESIGNFIADAVPVIVDFTANTLPAIINGTGAVLGVLGQVAPYIPTIGIALASLAAGPIGTVIAAIAAVTSYIVTLWNTNEEFRENVTRTWETICNFFSGIPGRISGFFSGIGSTIGGYFEDARQLALNAGQGILTFFAGIPSQIIGFFSGIGQNIANALTNIHFPTIHVKNFSLNPLDWRDNPPSIEWYAKGGIFTDPTIIGYGVGEAGPEAVLPLTPQGLEPVGEAVVDALGGGQTNIYIDGAQVNADEAVETLFYQFMTELSRLGTMGGTRFGYAQ